MPRLMLSLVAVSLLVGCGPNNPGSGTGTLFVWARLSSNGSTDGSNARIQVREASPFGPVVTDAQVSLQGNKLPKTTIAYADPGMEYRADAMGWDETLRLEVVRGQDRLEATVQSPGTSTITAPTNDATVPLGSALNITWRDGNNQPANTVRLRMDAAQLDLALATDDLEYTVPADKLVQTDRESIYLERSNEVALAGGVAGSLMSATTYHSVRFRVQQ